jgi:cobalt-zinc-cadmium efflux system protein
VTLINFGILVLEVVGGVLSNSLALLSDAVHKLGDGFSLVLAWIASRVGKRRADYRNTFGYKRIEILAALFNALLLVGICVFLVIEAWERFRNPEPIRGALMLAVAFVGLIADGISVLILQKSQGESINVRAAYLHLLGDTLSSVAVIAGGAAIWLWGWEWVDPAITALVSVYLVYHTWGVLKESVGILMEEVPKDLDLDEIKTTLETVPEVENIHHIHLWRLNDSRLYFETHVGLRENLDIRRIDTVRHTLESLLDERFGIDHTTLQFEYRPCANKGLIGEE